MSGNVTTLGILIPQLPDAQLPLSGLEYAVVEQNNTVCKVPLDDFLDELPLSGLTITHSTIDSSPIGQSVPAAGSFTALSGNVLATGSTTIRSLADRFSYVIWAVDYGVVADGGTDNTAALQRAVTAACAAFGKTVILPNGFIRVNGTITIPSGCVIRGSGSGGGSGSGNSGGTVVRTTNLAADVFAVQSDGAVLFQDFQIDTSGGFGSAGAGISITGSTSVGNQNTQIVNVNIYDTYDGVRIDQGAGFLITRSRIVDFTHNGVFASYSATCQDGCGAALGRNSVTSSVIADLNRGTSNANIELRGGGDWEILGNKFLGSAYGVELNLQWGPTGTLLVSTNSFEEQRTACMGMLQLTSGKEYADVAVIGNEFSSLGVLTTNGNVYVATGTPTIAPKWIRNITIGGNVFNSALASGSLIVINDGTGISVSNNVLDNNSAAGATGIAVGAAAANVALVNNIAQNIPGGLYGATNSAYILDASTGSFSTSVTTPLIKSLSGDITISPNGVRSVVFSSAASAVNYLNIISEATGNDVQLSFTGGDTNVGAQIFTKGAGGFTFSTHGDTGLKAQFQVRDNASATSVVAVLGGSTGDNPRIFGSSNNLSLGFGSALATNATSGMIMIPTTSGTPTGTPVGASTGETALQYDTGGHKIWVYDQPAGAWKSVAVT